jgi:F-type H+-transporting ATPase subunit gamma
MANAREIKTRIKTVKNTAKITRTMEMVATAKSKKAFDRIHALKPYAKKLSELIADLSQADDLFHPLLRKSETIRHVTLMVITANRGLCGGFNSNLLRLARKRFDQLKQEGCELSLWLIGKKGASFFRFMEYPMELAVTDLDEQVSFSRTEEISEKLVESYLKAKTDRIEIFSNRIKGAASTYPDSEVLLPIDLKEKVSEATRPPRPHYLFSPSPEKLLEKLLPLAVKTNFFRAVIESMAAELIARRVAMKNASDAANEMCGDLTRVYNRSRQASITQEIAEIVGGVEALK